MEPKSEKKPKKDKVVKVDFDTLVTVNFPPFNSYRATPYKFLPQHGTYTVVPDAKLDWFVDGLEITESGYVYVKAAMTEKDNGIDSN